MAATLFATARASHHGVVAQRGTRQQGTTQLESNGHRPRPRPRPSVRKAAARGAPEAAPAAPAAAAVASSDLMNGCVLSSLADRPILQQPGSTHAVVPLLLPQQHGLPFGMALELYAPSDGQPPLAFPPSASRELFELRYVLGGSGCLQRTSPQPPPPEELQPGDTVLCRHGAVRLASSGGAAAGAGAGAQLLWPGLPWALACLVVAMPRSLLEGEPKEEGSRQHGSVAAEAQPALAQLVQERWLGGQPRGALSPGAVKSLLLGAHDTARRALHSRPAAEQPRVEGDRAVLGARQAKQQQPVLSPQQLEPAAVSSAGAGPDSEDVTKRSLPDLPAFELPNQTNRLAVAFCPYSSPRGTGTPPNFIAGVEVFLPHHRTTPHVHPHAHELFFILGGAGTGFCGPPGRQARFPVAPGDVAVFRPGAVHGIDNGPDSKLVCLELMCPNDLFAELVRAGRRTGLEDDELCILTASVGCPPA